MQKTRLLLIACAIALTGLAAWLFLPPTVNGDAEVSSDPASIARGQYLVTAGGCISCHLGSEDESQLSGGLALETDFGIFYVPNITPDPATGVGDWEAADFLLALQHGRTPSGSFYFPAFPYRAYAGLSDNEVLDIAAYLKSLEPVVNQVPAPETPWWLSRLAVAGWNKLADMQQAPAEEFANEQVARGAHLARNLGHCGECHTPRNALGIPDISREYAGAELGDQTIEAIDAEALSEWTTESFDLFLLIGLKPDDEFAGGDMNDVIEHNTSKLTDADRAALAAFFTRHRSRKLNSLDLHLPFVGFKWFFKISFLTFFIRKFILKSRLFEL